MIQQLNFLLVNIYEHLLSEIVAKFSQNCLVSRTFLLGWVSFKRQATQQ